jgi:hypothetical protein
VRGLVISIGLAVFAAAAGGESDLQALLAAVDATRNAFDEAVISARATQILDGRETGSADFDIYVKGRDRGLIVFRGGKNSGRKVLTNGQRMWLIVPGSRNPVPITANQRLLGGASFADVARLRFSEDYVSRETGETEVAAGRSCRVLDLRAKAPAVTYPRVLLSVDGEKLPCRVRFFLSSGKEARAVTFTKFRREAGKTVVAEMEVRDLLGAASRVITRLEYRSFRSARLDEKIFTPEGARGL